MENIPKITRKTGTLPDSLITELIRDGSIIGASEEHVNPASLDLAVSDEIYRVERSFLPKNEETIRENLKVIGASPHAHGVPLESGVTYLARATASLRLPESVYGYCNPKSSTGRTDVHVRVMADGVARYDSIAPAGYHGEIWFLIKPQLIPIILPVGEPISQIRFFNADTRLKETELETVYRKEKLVFGLDGKMIPWSRISISDRDGSLILTADLTSKVIGWKCSGTKKVIDFGKRKFYAPLDFFMPMKKDGKGFIVLKGGNFYILSVREAVRIPPSFSCEMIPMDERSGEFRSHYAGFLDPGWGWGKRGEGKGRPFTLEVRPFEDIVLRDGQPIAKIRFERMIDEPLVNYDQKVKSHYISQKQAQLSKHFRQN